MTTTEPVALTELVLTGTPGEVTALTRLARGSGRLVHATTPQPMPGTDTRVRVRLFLQPTP